MKTYRILIAITIFICSITETFAQNTENHYRFSKITLLTGEVIDAKKITLSSDKVTFRKSNSTTGQKENVSFNLGEVQSIQATNETNQVKGLLIGTGTGVLAMIITEKILEKPKSGGSNSGIPWWSDGYENNNGEITHTMAFAPKVYIVLGGVLIGELIGSSIKKGWKTIFPNNSSFLKNVDLGLTADYNIRFQPGVMFTYKF